MNTNKLTLEDFTKKAISKFENRKMVTDIEIDSFGGTLTFTRPTENQLIEYTNDNANAVETKENSAGKHEVIGMNMPLMLQASKKLLYNTCSFLRDSELQKAMNIMDPYDIASQIFGIDESIELAGKVASEFKDNKVEEIIKN